MQATTPHALVFTNVSHAYGHRKVLKDVSFSIGSGQIVCLLGPSGCGKTTCLRLAAGLEPLQSGTIDLNGLRVAGQGFEKPVEERGIGFVFQDFALFPHMNILANVTFGVKNKSANEKLAVAEVQLSNVGLWDRRNDYPHELSGGERQRVALARALATDPYILLMDEPFSGLDMMKRRSIRRDVRDLIKKQNFPALMVTHDPQEAREVADVIMVMRDGRLVEVAPSESIGQNSKDDFVRELFL